MKNRWTKRTKRANRPPWLVSRRDPVGFTPGVRIVSENCNNFGALWFYILIPREGTGLRRGVFELWSRSVPSILYNEYIIEEFILYIESCLPQYPWSWLHHDAQQIDIAQEFWPRPYVLKLNSRLNINIFVFCSVIMNPPVHVFE